MLCAALYAPARPAWLHSPRARPRLPRWQAPAAAQRARLRRAAQKCSSRRVPRGRRGVLAGLRPPLSKVRFGLTSEAGSARVAHGLSPPAPARGRALRQPAASSTGWRPQRHTGGHQWLDASSRLSTCIIVRHTLVVSIRERAPCAPPPPPQTGASSIACHLERSRSDTATHVSFTSPGAAGTCARRQGGSSQPEAGWSKPTLTEARATWTFRSRGRSQRSAPAACDEEASPCRSAEPGAGRRLR